MMGSFERILLEGGAVAANSKSATHRMAAARELASIDLDGILTAGEGRAHLALAIREAVLGLASLTSEPARAAAVDGLRVLVRAARAEPGQRHHQPPQAHELPYWVLL